MTVHNLDKFVLENIFRPYQYTLGIRGLPLKILTKEYNTDTVLKLFKDFPEWEKLVMSRINIVGVSFSKYLVHPLIDYIKKRINNHEH